MDFCGEVHCDFIHELKKRHMEHLMEHILFELDLDSVRNVRLVSKTWATAVTECNKKIWRNLIKQGNDGHLNLRVLLGKHLELNFPVPVEDEFYLQRFCNTIYYSSEEISRASFVHDFTVDYLPYYFSGYYSKFKDDLDWMGKAWYHFEMNDSYIVTVDPNDPRLLNFWSRRFLTSTPQGNMTRVPLDIEIHPEGNLIPGEVTFPGRNFRISGGKLILGSFYYHAKPDLKTPINPAVFILGLKVNRDFPGSAIDGYQNKRPVTLFDPSPLGLIDYFVSYLTVEGRFLLVVFEDLDRCQNETKLSLVVWALDEPHSSPWKHLEVPFTHGDNYFLDEKYLVVLNHEDGLPTTFLVYSMLERETGPARAIASIDVEDYDPDGQYSKLADTVQYKNGFLVIGSHRGDVRFVEVKSGRTVRTLQTGINFSAPGSIMRISNSSEGFYVCFTASPPLRGTVFQRWNFNDVIKLGSSLPLASFSAFTGKILDFKFDELGIVAVMKEEGRHGMQILSFLPQCSGCKRISKTIPLKCCSRCKRAKYCSRECQQSNWNHHKAICSKLAVTR